jgi:hypothetical protein
MAGGTYATLIPAYTYPLGDEASTSMVFGFDYQEVTPTPVSLIPVLVEEPMGRSYLPREVMNRWKECFQWLFLSSPPEDNPFNLGPQLRNNETANNIREAVKMVADNYEQYGSHGLSRFDDVFRNFIIGLRVLPRRVVKSPCQECAQDGGWTMTLSWALWHPDKAGLFPRWNPLMPAQPQSAAAQDSHDADLMELACEVWLSTREMYKDEVPNAEQLTYFEAIEEVGDDGANFVNEVEKEAERAWKAEVMETHQTMWHPPDWLYKEFEERLRSEATALTEGDTLQSRMFRWGISDPYDDWHEALRRDKTYKYRR